MDPTTLDEQALAALIHFCEEGIPFNKHMGMKVVSMAVGQCVLRMPIRPHHIGDPSRPALHGGTLSALADTAGGLAVFTKLQGLERTSTVDLRIDYLRPGRVDHDVLADARVIRMGNRVAAIDCVLYQEDAGAPIAVARAAYNVVRR